eukprot:6123256-Pyramimonas_sp.AAC.1
MPRNAKQCQTVSSKDSKQREATPSNAEEMPNTANVCQPMLCIASSPAGRYRLGWHGITCYPMKDLAYLV